MWRFGATLLVCIASCVLVPALRAEPSLDRVLADLKISKHGICTRLQVRFNARIRYVTHFPRSHGLSVQVRIEPLEDPAGIFRSLRREGLSIPRDVADLVQGIEYERSTTSNPTLTVNFRDDFYYEVGQGRDFRSVIVAVSGRTADAACNATQGEGADSLGNSPTMMPPEGFPPPGPNAGVPTPNPGATAPPPLPPGALTANPAQLLIEAREAIAAKDYNRAVQLLTKIIELPESSSTQEARELLGLARERNGQIAQAKGEYEDYLKLYPTGPGADRVRQRLAGILGTPTGQPELRRLSGGGRERPRGFQANGSLSQFYDYDMSQLTTNQLVPAAAGSGTDFINQSDTQKTTNLNQVLSAADLSAAYNTPELELRARAAGTYANQFTADQPNQSSLSSFYLEASDPDKKALVRVGRQTHFSDGVLGRFDGAFGTFETTDWLKFNLASGYPVTTSRQMSVDTDRYFYSGGLSLGRSRAPVTGGVYYIRQYDLGLLDREAVGGEIHLLDNRRSGFATIDYDLLFNQIDLGLMSWSWTFADLTNASFSLDYRRSPLLTLENALQGQLASPNLLALLNSYTLKEIQQLALDRTSVSKMATLSLSRPFASRFQISFDGTISNVSGTPASGGVDATPPTGYEYYYTTNLVASDLLMNGDSTITGLSYFDTQTSNRYVADLSTRFPFTHEFRFNPRVRYSYRESKTSDATQSTIRPSVRLNYYLLRNLEFETEFGAEWVRDSQSMVSTDTQTYFLDIGYRLDF